MKLKNPVAKFANEYNKPKTFRDRKKEAKKDGNYAEHPKHQPYSRETNLRHDLIAELYDAEDIFRDTSGDEEDERD